MTQHKAVLESWQIGEVREACDNGTECENKWEMGKTEEKERKIEGKWRVCNSFSLILTTKKYRKISENHRKIIQVQVPAGKNKNKNFKTR